MEEIKFKSLNELFNRLYPALNTKSNELQRSNINVSEIDLWNYLKKTVWQVKEDLNLYEMVNDIFEIDIPKLLAYKRSKNDNN